MKNYLSFGFLETPRTLAIHPGGETGVVAENCSEMSTSQKTASVGDGGDGTRWVGEHCPRLGYSLALNPSGGRFARMPRKRACQVFTADSQSLGTRGHVHGSGKSFKEPAHSRRCETMCVVGFVGGRGRQALENAMRQSCGIRERNAASGEPPAWQ